MTEFKIPLLNLPDEEADVRQANFAGFPSRELMTDIMFPSIRETLQQQINRIICQSYLLKIGSIRLTELVDEP